jgi:hypothetical protein
MLDYVLDDSILAACVPTLEDDQQLMSMLDDVLLQLDQFNLQSTKRRFVFGSFVSSGSLAFETRHASSSFIAFIAFFR